MSSKNKRKGSNSINKDEEDKKIWEELTIYFQLESTVFSENKIYGTLTIEPEEALRLIEHFELVPNHSNRVKFSCKIGKISASGFDPTETNLSIHIEAIPKNKEWRPVQSPSERFFIIPQRLPLTPSIHFHWASEKDLQPSVIVRWFHRGDQIADKYIFCFDDKEIQYILEPLHHDVYQVCIRHFKPGATHTIQIIARLNNGNVIYQSDRITFTVPDKPTERQSKDIKVYVEPGMADDLKGLMDEDEVNDDRKNPPRSKPLTEQPPTHRKVDTILSCGCSGPHKTFLGVGHYFNVNNNKPSSLSQSNKRVQPRKTVPYDEEHTHDTNNEYHRKEKRIDDDDDDDDVVVIRN